MDLGGIRRLYLPLRPKARFSPGRKTPPGVSAPSTGLRPLIVSRVKCGGGPCRGHSVLPCTGNTICLHCAFIKGARFGICLRKHVVAATGPSPFKVGDNQRPERTMSGVRKPPPESSVPGENLTRGSRRNQLRRGHGSPPVLSEVPHELSIPMRTPKSANGPRSNSFRPDSPSTTNFPRGRKTQPSPSPHRTWSVPDASSGPQLNLHTEKRFPPHQAETFFLL